MKKILIFLFLFSSLQVTFGQQWPEIGTTWTYRVISTGWLEYLHLRADRDTLINNETATVLESNKLIFLTSPDGDSIKFSKKTPIHNDLILRNVNDSIFYRYEETWKFMYDFEAEIGDIWTVEGSDSTACFNFESQEEYYPPISSQYIIDDILDLEYGGLNVKTIKYNTSGQYWRYGSSGSVILKDIGSHGSFLPYLNCNDDWANHQNIYMITESLLCFDNTMGITINTDTLCEKISLLTHTDNYKISENLDKIIIYPNPTNGGIYFLGEQNVPAISKVEIFDISGKLVQLNSNIENNIQLSNLNKGIYFCSITLENNIVITKKICKLRD